MSAPDFLPTLSAGSHDAEHGEACVMEYVSLLAGEEWSDRPECTHELLAHEARTVNDLLRDSDRSRLVPLIGRLFGTTDDSPALRARLRITPGPPGRGSAGTCRAGTGRRSDRTR
ncbi:hypothetical protein [Aeromicrobium sp. UC242_57]|uniref:hypothetical protein n=1 Tax=Aeromicrobium sp. UC242_57 TaxID=3374624 RepID=UPI003794C952